MKQFKVLFAAALFFVASVVLFSCAGQQTEATTEEPQGAPVEETIEAATEAVETTVDSLGNAVQNATEEVKDAVEGDH
jgi:hypothetical protein